MKITEHMEEDTETGIKGAGSELEQVLDDGVLTFQFPTRTSGKVAIVGFAGGHHYQAPFKDESVETWGINRLWVELPDRRWTRWFELHDLGLFYRDDEDHKQFLRSFTGPVYVREQDYALALEWGIDTAVPFPHRILTEQFQPYFTNTVSWLLALAILMDFEHIGVYGVDMAVDNVMQAEYGEQRPSCEYFLGIAHGRGIQTFIPHGSDLLKASHLYGYEDSGPVLMKMAARFQELGRAKEGLRAQAQQLHAQANTLEGQLSQLDGAMQEVAYWKKNWLINTTYKVEVE